ncbi:MAG: TIGR00341 family protein [Syntrophomonadales bacterium]|jgi:uncharacterized hydrophobic protein (TIGR00271 family)
MSKEWTELFNRRRMPQEQRRVIYQKITDLSSPSPSFHLMVCLSTIIAAFGLLSNSVAVVIGAMLVAPLMGPIFGIALSLSTGNSSLLRRALVAEIIGIMMAVGLSYIIGLVPIRPDFGSEILARTQPTIYDIIVALASGLAGAYALVDEKISPALPGVAIATAIVPPLATVGLNLATGQWSMAGGAASLFLVNFLCIEFAAAVVFVVSGLTSHRTENGNTLNLFVRRFGISVIALVLATVFMTGTLVSMVEERRFENDLRVSLEKQLYLIPGAYLEELDYYRNGNSLEVMSTVLTPQEVGPERVSAMEKVLQEEIDPACYLIVRSLLSKDSDSHGPVFIDPQELLRRNQQRAEHEFMNRLSRILTDELRAISNAQLVEIIQEAPDSPDSVVAVVRNSYPINPDQVSALQAVLREKLQTDTRLIVRSVITRNADADQFLQTVFGYQPLLDAQVEMKNQVEVSLREQLQRRFPAAIMTELQFYQHADEIMVLSVVRSPELISPNAVREMEDEIENQMGRPLSLIVRSTVGGDATAEGYTYFNENRIFNTYQPAD